MKALFAFDRLIHEFSADSRRKMFEQITRQSPISEIPLIEKRSEDIALYDIEDDYTQFGVLSRL